MIKLFIVAQYITLFQFSFCKTTASGTSTIIGYLLVDDLTSFYSASFLELLSKLKSLISSSGSPGTSLRLVAFKLSSSPPDPYPDDPDAEPAL